MSLIAIPIGIVAALAATAFLWLVEETQALLFQHLPAVLGISGLPWWWVAVPLTIGVTMVWLAIRMNGGAGGGPLSGFHFHTPFAHVPSILLAAFGSLIAGASLGPEAPLIVVGSVLGAVFGIRNGGQTQQAFAFIGGMAAVGAVFGSPMVTAFMMLEFMALGAAPVVLLIPALVGLAASYLVQIGAWVLPGVGAHSLSVPNVPSYAHIELGDFSVAALVAIVATVLAVLVRVAAERFDSFSASRRTTSIVLASLGVLALAAIGMGGFGLAPELVLFSGNAGMGTILAETSVVAVLVALLVKSGMMLFSLGGQFRGGAIFPATFLGVGVGVLMHLLLPETALAAAVTTGIATSAAVFTKLPATSSLLAVLLISTAGITIAPFAIFGAVFGTLARIVFDRSTEAAEPTTD